MSSPDFGFLAKEDLPSREAIVAMCQEAGYERTGIPLRYQPSGPVEAWIKYGPNVTVDEALTQDWVAKALEANPEASMRAPRVHMAFSVDTPDCSIGYIVMEYIDALDCDESDFLLVATAVQTLIGLQGPNLAPGPIGGGPIMHTFFVEWTSSVTYKTVEELEEHINGILAFMGDIRRVNLVADAHEVLRLCPCDVTPGNFKKREDGQVVALDFNATCFLPPSFFAVAMKKW
ncbi:hypothetical protein FRC01_013435, partial [Tulasnella sp. 417]